MGTPPYSHMVLTTYRLRAPIPDVCRLHAIAAAAAHPHPGAPRLLWANPTPDHLVLRTPHPIGGILDSHGTPVSEQPWTTPGPGKWRVAFAVNPVTRHNSTATAIPDDALEPWLRDKLAAAITIDTVTVTGRHTARGTHRNAHRIAHRIVTGLITGTIASSQAEAAHHLAINGVGRGRAYGAGLTIWQPA